MDSECPWTSPDECAMVQERNWHPGWPCRTHGGYCEVCEEFFPALQPAMFAARKSPFGRSQAVSPVMVCAGCAEGEREMMRRDMEEAR